MSTEIRRFQVVVLTHDDWIRDHRVFVNNHDDLKDMSEYLMHHSRSTESSKIVITKWDKEGERIK